ncbi:M24 family metallopeptidase [Paeniglutamicibacter psychrophenolicus]|uniref:Xaa-Pro aminopeptidase n=1 Tax=Paeniglutamicibacter psychrophenolicus TaxID=257454 RepID=A0ABS4W9U4_9MICC|nr:M24 family metallopeptidase [Paeniglutamicibacter psychrophenolicus]MBP2372965.1 Xaa-Pro aminopeptidase [Paeniglutamicibacter psychrophenolicus]
MSIPATLPDPELSTKHARLAAILEARGADGLVLRSPGALGWFLGGARTHVSLAGAPVAEVLVQRNGAHLLVFGNEAARLFAEELPVGLETIEVPWAENLSAHTGRTATDLGLAMVLDEDEVALELRAARAALLPLEQERYRQLCADTARTLGDVLFEAVPRDTERGIASRLAARLMLDGSDPLVVLVAGADRLGFRHPLPTANPVGNMFMAVLCARREGLIANVTRWVSFAPRSAGQLRAEASILEVEAEILEATRPGVSLASILPVIQAAYPRHGFETDEWIRHHQGGPTGYVGRDPRLVPGVTDTVVAGQAFAWNPSAPGVKVEDTMLLTETGFEVLSVDPRWPTLTVAGRQRPAILER